MNRGIYLGLGGLALAAVVTGFLTRSGRQPAEHPPVASERARPAVGSAPRGALAPGPAPSAAATPPAATFAPGVLGAVRGRIVNRETGQGLPGVQIWHGKGERNLATSGPQGEFSLGALPTGKPLRLRVEKTSAGYLADVIDMRDPAGVPEVDTGTTPLLRGNWDQRLGTERPGMTGINSELRDGKVYVSKVRPGTPAETAGIRPGDRIVSVDGTPVDGMGHRARSYLLQGAPDTQVALALESPGGGVRQVTLRRMAGDGPARWPFTQTRSGPRRSMPASR